MLLVAAAVLLSSCGEDGDDAEAVSAASSPVEPVPEQGGVSGKETIAKDDAAGWVLTAEETGDGPCVHFMTPLGGGEGCGEGYLGSMNATIMPAEVREDTQAKSPVPVPDALFEFAYVYGSVPVEVDLVRVNTSLGDHFETEVIRPANGKYAYFVVAIPAAQAPMQMQLEKTEFARHDRVDEAGDLVWSESLIYLATNG